MKKFFGNKPRAWFLIGLAIVIILVLACMGIKYFWKTDVVAVVGDEKILVSDLNREIYGVNFEGTPESPDPDGKVKQEEKELLLKNLIKRKIVDQEITDEEKTYTEEEFKEEGLKRLGEDGFELLGKRSQTEREIIDSNIKYGIWERGIESRVVSSAAGDLIIARFDKYNSGEDSVNYNKDKEYATAVINNLYSKMLSKQITVEQAISQTLADGRLNNDYFAPNVTELSQSFTETNFKERNRILSSSPIVEAILESEDGINKPIIISGEDEDGKAVERHWLIVNIKEKNDGQYERMEEWLNEFYERDGFIKIYAKDYQGIISGKTAGIATVSAHSGTHSCDNVDHLGIATGNPDSTAGLRLYTQYYNGSGGGPNPINTWFSVRATYFGGTNHGVCYTPSGASCGASDQLQEASFQTGNQPYYYSSGTCYKAGWLGLGYGTTSASAYGNFGNKWTLDCSSNPFTVTVENNVQGRVGFWDVLTASYTVSNGYTTAITRTWYDNTPPIPIYNTPAAGAEYTIASGQTTYPIRFSLSADDANGDTVGLGAAYCVADPTTHNCTGGWNYADEAHSTSFANGGLFAPVQGTAGTNRSMPTANINLPAGHYRYLIFANDAHGACDSTQGDAVAGGPNCWTHDTARWFTIRPAAAAEPLACTCTPQSGLSPLVVSVSASGGIPPYDFDFNEAGVPRFLDRTSPFVYTYATAGTKTVNCYDSSPVAATASCTVTVNSDSDPDGGEVAP